MFIWRNIVSIRNRAFLLLTLPVLSLVTLFTPFFTETASAVTADDVLNRARAWSILSAVINKGSKLDENISPNSLDKCEIFGDSIVTQAEIFVGYHVTGNTEQDGRIGATWKVLQENASAVISALDSVGIAGGCRGLLDKLGYTFSNGEMHRPDNFSDNDGRLVSRLRGVINDNAFFGPLIGDSRPAEAISYAILYYNLTKKCGWEYRNPFVENDTATTTEGGRNREAQGNGWSGEYENNHYRTYTYQKGTAGWNTYYKGIDGREDSVFVGSYSGFVSGNNDAQLDCGRVGSGETFGAKLADNHNFADAYAAVLKPGGNTTPGTCADRYTGSAAQLASCDAGYKNRSNLNFCAATYPAVPIDSNGPILDACQYGAISATGGADATTPPPEDGTGGNNPDKTTCAIDGIGWIICPIVNFLAKITDAAYVLVSLLLEVEPLSTTNNSGIFNAWSIMRNFANIAFVIFFLVIIFSQLTSAGINNYNIKKMLPKLVVAAILVNVSYWICAIAVDLSNILGGSLKDLLEAVQNNAGGNSSQFSWSQTSSGLLGGLIGGVVVTPILFYTTLSVLLPMLVTVLATIVSVFLALVLRQVLIIILIVISPLAFVMYLLPNTESLFKKWRTTFQLLLVVYPVIAFVFGASALASTIIMMSSTEFYIQIAGAGASIIPLIAAPALISGVNKVANRFGLPNVGVKLGGLQKRAEGLRDKRKDIAATRRLGRAKRVLKGTGGRLGGEGTRRRRLAAWAAGAGASTGLNAEQRAEAAKRDLAEAKQDYIIGRAGGGGRAAEEYARSIAGPTGDAAKVAKIIANAWAGAAANQIEEIKAARAKIDQAHFDLTNTRLIAQGRGATQRDAAGNVTGVVAANDVRARQAAIQKIIQIGDIGGIRNLIDNAGAMDSDIRKVIADSLETNKPTFVSAIAIDGIRQGAQNITTDNLVETAINKGAYSADKLAKADADEVSLVASALVSGSGTLDQAAAQRAVTDARTAFTDPRYGATKNRGNLENVINGRPGTPIQ